MPLQIKEPTQEAIHEAIGSQEGGIPMLTIAANFVVAAVAFFTPLELIDIHVDLLGRGLIYLLGGAFVTFPVTLRAYRKRGETLMSGLEKQFGPNTLREVNRRIRKELMAPLKGKDALRFDYEKIAEQMGELQKK